MLTNNNSADAERRTDRAIEAGQAHQSGRRRRRLPVWVAATALTLLLAILLRHWLTADTTIPASSPPGHAESVQAEVMELDATIAHELGRLKAKLRQQGADLSQLKFQAIRKASDLPTIAAMPSVYGHAGMWHYLLDANDHVTAEAPLPAGTVVMVPPLPQRHQVNARRRLIELAITLKFPQFTRYHDAAPASQCIGMFEIEPLDALAKRVEVEVFDMTQRIEDMQHCQLIFFGLMPSRTLLNHLHQASVVTVSNVPGFLAEGGMVEFFQIGHKVRFKLNLDAAEAAGIRFGSKLLRLAVIE